jgi:hypothetical protein
MNCCKNTKKGEKMATINITVDPESSDLGLKYRVIYVYPNSYSAQKDKHRDDLLFTIYVKTREEVSIPTLIYNLRKCFLKKIYPKKLLGHKLIWPNSLIERTS